MIHTCSHCLGKIPVWSQISVSVVCESCQHVFQVFSDDIVEIGQTKRVPEDMTPLKTGTKGIINKKPFEVAGRIRYEFGDAYFNHWAIYLEDKTWMWLGEGYGVYAVFGLAEHTLDSSVISKIKAGTSIRVSPQKAFVTILTDNATGYTAEGELPELIAQFMPFKWIEGTNEFKELIGFKVFSNGKVVSVQGYLADFDSFEFKNLRELNGWI